MIGESSGIVELPVKTSLPEIVEIIKETYPRIKELGDCFTLSLNEEYIADDPDKTLNLSSSDEIAIIPPLSGG